MKRFCGLILALCGGAFAGWGAVSVLRGSVRSRLDFGSDVTVDALTGGLAGLAVLVIGLVWMRD